MKYPTIRQQTSTTVTVPALSGGINLHDTPSEVEDNQLTAANNMWWHKAALRSRPGVNRTADTYDAAYTDRQWISDREVLLTSCKPSGSTAPFYAAKMTQEGGFQKLGKNGAPYNAKFVNGKAPTAFGCHAVYDVNEEADKQADFLCFLSSGEIIQNTPNGWVAAEPYVPTVMINGKGISHEHSEGGVSYESYNLLNSKYSCQYRTDDNCCSFLIPKRKYGVKAKVVSVEITLQSNSGIRTIKLKNPADDNERWTYETGSSGVSVTAEEIGDTARSSFPNATSFEVFYTSDTVYVEEPSFLLVCRPTGSDNWALWYPPALRQDNLKAVAEESSNEQRARICKMTKCAWFGGDRSGIGGGTRLFVTGNAEEKNLVHWSDVNNPLYFPDKNYAYVGDYSQAVTGFGKQENLLIIFKEHEMYGTEYVAGSEADFALAKSSGMDGTSFTAKFPLTPIHSSIGCDCPGSIRLVNNRLVWANSDGTVYMLPTVNQYNERNVRTISRNIFPLLSSHSAAALKRSFAGEYYGYYVLLIENKLYLLDAQTSAFTSFNYYAKEENAQKALPWYVWTLPHGEYTGLVANDTAMYLTATVDGVGCVFAVGGDTDDGAPISCSFTTKIFDFNRPDSKKTVNQIYVAVGDTPTSETNVSYVTEHGETADAFTLESRGDYDQRDAGYMVTHRLTPHVSRVRMFGIRFQSVGGISIGKLLLKFKTQGVIR